MSRKCRNDKPHNNLRYREEGDTEHTQPIKATSSLSQQDGWETRNGKATMNHKKKQGPNTNPLTQWEQQQTIIKQLRTAAAEATGGVNIFYWPNFRPRFYC